jgi:hypothetical protein
MGIISSLGGSSPYTNVGVIPTRHDICHVIYSLFDESGKGASWSNILAAVDKAVIAWRRRCAGGWVKLF